MDTKMIMKVVLIVAVCAGTFFGYRYFFGSSSDEQLGVTTVGADGQARTDQPVDNESQQFLTLLASVENVGSRLKENFVQDRFFKMLQDYTVPVTPKPISRSNPFLPIGMGGRYMETNPIQAVSIISEATTSATSTATTTKKATAKPAIKTPTKTTVKIDNPNPPAQEPTTEADQQLQGTF